MPRRLIRFLASAAVLSAALWLARWALVRWIDGPKQMPSSRPWPPLPATDEAEGRALATPEPATRTLRTAAPEPVPAPDPIAAPQPAPTPERAATPADSQPTAGPEPAPVATSSAGSAGPSWLAPHEPGTCPRTHPVKAKLSTRLYREPGTAAYDRAQPDRCYASPEAAEADGFRRAKR